MILISISGKKRSGKDTIAQMIGNYLEVVPYHRMAFADALKKEVSDACKVTPAFIEANKESFRTILQWWGTDFRRKFSGEDYWINILLNKLLVSTAELIIVPDVRFQNEYEVLRNLGAFMFYIDRPASDKDNHASEVSLTKDGHYWDFIVNNNGTLEQLDQTIKEICINLRKQLKLMSYRKSA